MSLDDLDDELLEESLLWSDTEEAVVIDSNEEEELLLNGSMDDILSLKKRPSTSNGTSISESLEKTMLEDVTITYTNYDEVNLDITLGTRDMFDTSVECDSTEDILDISEVKACDPINGNANLQLNPSDIILDSDPEMVVIDLYTWQDGDVLEREVSDSVVDNVSDLTVPAVTKDELQMHTQSEDNFVDEEKSGTLVKDISLASNVTTNGNHVELAAAVPKRLIEPADSDDQTPLPKRIKTTSLSGPSPPSLDVSIRSRFQSDPHPSGSSLSPTNTTPPLESKPLLPTPDSKPALLPTPNLKPLLPTPETKSPGDPLSDPPVHANLSAEATSDKPVTDPSLAAHPTVQIISLNYSNYFKKDSPFVCKFCNKKIENSKSFEDHIISYHAVRIIMKDFTVKTHDQYIAHAEYKKALAARVNSNPRLNFLRDPVLVKDFKSNIELKAGKFFCKPCKNIYLNESLIKEHLQGKKHKYVSLAETKTQSGP